MANDQVVYKLSRKAARMIRSGQAEWTPGGIRDKATKKILELARPVRENALSQKEVLNRISQSTQAVQALSWVNATMSLVNVGISVAGFYMTLTRLESMQGELRQFIETYGANQRSETLETYNNHLQKLTNLLAYLQSRYTTKLFDQQDFMNHRIGIENECIETANFIIRVLNDFQGGLIDARLACQIIFTLTPVYAQLVNEYCCQFFCLCRQKHYQFDSWLSVMDEINSEQFRYFMKKQMAFNVEYAELHPQRRQDVLTVTFDCVEELKDNLVLSAETIQSVPENTLIPVEHLIQQRTWDSVREILPVHSDETPEEFMNRTIMQMAVDENDEVVYVRV